MMDLVSEDELAGKTLRIRVLPEFFPGSWKHACGARAQRLRWFDYGYALTVHKAQGSQWDDVILFDESYAFREHRARWLYTGITAYLEAGECDIFARRKSLKSQNSQKVLSPISNVHAATSKLWLLSPPTAAENYFAFRSHDAAKSL
jgi:UvrD-like helicase C-terminal domain